MPLMKLIMLILLLLLLNSSQTNCSQLYENTTDMLSLLDFKEAVTNDPKGTLSSWNSTTPFCNLKGVKCSSTRPGRVVALDLSGQSLAGVITGSIGNLTFLEKLDLSTNQFSGLLPPLNHLHMLQLLNLSTNSLQDVIPEALVNCSSLKILELSKNFMAGEISLKLDLLSNLLVLRLSWNNFTGIIPPTLSNITHLERLALASNHLTGTIPK